MRTISRTLILGSALSLISCGSQDPAFQEQSGGVFEYRPGLSAESDANASKNTVVLSSPDGSGVSATIDMQWQEGTTDYVSDVNDENVSQETASTESGTGGTTGSGSTSSGSAGSNAEISACAASTNTDYSNVKFVDKKSNQAMVIDSNSVLMFKITGNESKFYLKIAGNFTPKGICLFLAGNKSVATLDVDVALGSFFMKGRGNQATGYLNMLAGGSVADSSADLSGNKSVLNIRQGSTDLCKSTQTSVAGNSLGARCL